MWQDNGFLQEGETDAQDAMEQLGVLITQVRAKYESLSAEELLQHPAPGKWSRQQVLGHLIDSAVNNLKRFTDAQLQDQPYIIVSYKQDGLMEVNGYQELPLQHLLHLWQALNQQIIFVVKKIPEAKRSCTVQPQYNHTGTETLEWLICDYVAHMKHHLGAMEF
jgi:uncharacterized damage-inducible protein DinB